MEAGLRSGTREWLVGGIASVVAVASNAIVHLGLLEEHKDPEWIALIVMSAISLVLAGLLFGWLIPRLKGSRSVGWWALGLSLISIPGIVLWWTGVTFIIAAAGVALGIWLWQSSTESRPKWQGVIAAAVGAVIFVLLIIGPLQGELSGDSNELDERERTGIISKV